MLRPQHQHLLQRLLPGIQGLPRQSGHQIHIHIGKSRHPHLLVGAEEIIICMDPAQNLQLPVVGGLKPQADPVDSSLPVALQLVLVQGSGINLYGDLRIFPQIKIVRRRLEDSQNVLSRKNGRSSPADKYAGHLIPLDPGALPDNLINQFFHVLPLNSQGGRHGEKIAVGAFPLAERDMNIKFQGFFLITHRPISARS